MRWFCTTCGEEVRIVHEDEDGRVFSHASYAGHDLTDQTVGSYDPAVPLWKQKLPWRFRLSLSAERLGERHAMLVARSEAEIERRTAAGNPPTEDELRENQRTLSIAASQAERAQSEYDGYVARHG